MRTSHFPPSDVMNLSRSPIGTSLPLLLELQRTLYPEDAVLSNSLFGSVFVPQPEYGVYSFLGQNYLRGMDRAIQQSEREVPTIKTVLSQEGEKLLSLKKFNSKMPHGKRCPITQNELEEGGDIICLPCGHYFEPESIKKWLTEKSAQCPVCRSSLPSKEICDLPDSPRAEQEADLDSDFEAHIAQQFLNEMMLPGGSQPSQVTIFTYRSS